MTPLTLRRVLWLVVSEPHTVDATLAECEREHCSSHALWWQPRFHCICCCERLVDRRSGGANQPRRRVYPLRHGMTPSHMTPNASMSGAGVHNTEASAQLACWPARGYTTLTTSAANRLKFCSLASATNWAIRCLCSAVSNTCRQPTKVFSPSAVNVIVIKK